MPGPNVYFTQGTVNEQRFMEDIIIESLHIFGQNLFYIPRSLVSKDDILGEDRLSEFKTAFPIEAFFENVDSFDGQGAFMQKFGLMMEQSATLVIARRRWEQLVGRYGQTTIPTRPNEGDLMYFPLTGGLFEIKFVKHQDPFYQLGRLYVYKLQVELFQYSSERIDTGIPEVDVFESLKTFSTNLQRSGVGGVKHIDVTDPGFGYTEASVNVVPGEGFIGKVGIGATAEAVIEDGSIVAINVLNGGNGYTEPPLIVINGDGFGASAVAVVEIDIDKVESYGDNNAFKEQAKGTVFSEFNPFGEIDPPVQRPPTPPPSPPTTDSLNFTADSDTLTADRL